MTGYQFRACALIALLASTLSGCQEEAIVATIGAQVRRGPGHQLALSEVALFDWNRVCLFGPYTPAATLVQTTGLPDAARVTHGIESNDGIALLLFLDGDRIVREVTLPRAEGDFAPELLGKCYSPRNAIFDVRVAPPNSSGNIGPVEAADAPR